MNFINTQDAIKSYFHRRGAKYSFCNKLNTFYRNAITKYSTLLKDLFRNMEHIEMNYKIQEPIVTVGRSKMNRKSIINKPNETATTTKQTNKHSLNNEDDTIINVRLMYVQNLKNK